jgi:hypothetical protein
MMTTSALTFPWSEISSNLGPSGNAGTVHAHPAETVPRLSGPMEHCGCSEPSPDLGESLG